MNIVSSPPAPRQPNLIACLLEGFDTAANRAWLLLFPITLDLWIWLGPHFFLRSILTRAFDGLNRMLASIPSEALPPGTTTTNPWGSAEMAAMLQEFQASAVERLNLMYALRTFPVGVPSAMSSRLPVATPWGNAWGIDLPSVLLAAGTWLLLVLLGLGFGTLFYQLVAQAALQKRLLLAEAVRLWPRQTVFISLFSLGWGIVIFPRPCSFRFFPWAGAS